MEGLSAPNDAAVVSSVNDHWLPVGLVSILLQSCNRQANRRNVAHPADGAKTGQDCRAEVLVRNIALQMLTGLLGIPNDLIWAPLSNEHHLL